MEIENLNAVKLAVFSAGARLGVKSTDTQRERLGQCVVAVAKHLGVSSHMIRRLIQTGALHAEQVMRGAPHQIRTTDLEADQVKTAIARKGRPCRAPGEDMLPMFTDT